jgi:uncharacterized protein YggT (Ycf19 family)
VSLTNITRVTITLAWYFAPEDVPKFSANLTSYKKRNIFDNVFDSFLSTCIFICQIEPKQRNLGLFWLITFRLSNKFVFDYSWYASLTNITRVIVTPLRYFVADVAKIFRKFDLIQKDREIWQFFVHIHYLRQIEPTQKNLESFWLIIYILSNRFVFDYNRYASLTNITRVAITLAYLTIFFAFWHREINIS